MSRNSSRSHSPHSLWGLSIASAVVISLAPALAVAANLAWQTQAFSASPSLHRQNLFARLAWTTGPWESALDMLYHPADGGRLLTASLAWKGDRLRLEGGLRVSAGPGTAVVRQLPVQRQAFVQAVWVLD